MLNMAVNLFTPVIQQNHSVGLKTEVCFNTCAPLAKPRNLLEPSKIFRMQRCYLLVPDGAGTVSLANLKQVLWSAF